MSISGSRRIRWASLTAFSAILSIRRPICRSVEAGHIVLAFGDYSYYNIGDRGVRSMQVLKELFAEHGMVGFVMKERVDGKLVQKEAVQVLKIKA